MRHTRIKARNKRWNLKCLQIRTEASVFLLLRFAVGKQLFNDTALREPPPSGTALTSPTK